MKKQSDDNLIPNNPYVVVSRPTAGAAGRNQKKWSHEMALIKIESGRVLRYVGTRGAFAVEEYVNLPDGRSFPKVYTVWHEGTAPEIDGIVQVHGELSVKVREYQAGGVTKHVADISINQPTVQAIGVNALKNVEAIQYEIAKEAMAGEPSGITAQLIDTAKEPF